MKRPHWTNAAALAIFCAVNFPANAVGCDSIITHGLRNISISKSDEALVAAKWFNHCEKNFDQMSDEQLAKASAEVFGYGSARGEYSREKRSERLNDWCKSNKETANNNKSTVFESQTFYQGAVTAWESCMNLRNKHLLIEPIISPDARTVDIGVVYRGPSEGVAFVGLPTENFECKAQTPEGREIRFPYRVKNESVQIRCTRASPVERSLGNETFTVSPRGTISVQTASDPFQLFFAEQWEPEVPVNRAKELRRDLVRQDIPVGTVIRSSLSPEQFMNPLNPTYAPDRWMLADGSELPSNSLYARLTGETHVPDLRAEAEGLAVLDIVGSALPHGAPLTTIASENGNRGSWRWMASLRDVRGNRPNQDWQQAEDQFLISVDGGTVVAQGRTFNFKHGKWGNWLPGTANVLGISVKPTEANYYIKIN